MNQTEPSTVALLLRLWNLESRAFLDYFLGVSAPEVVDDRDRKILEAFRDAGAASPGIRDRLMEVFRWRGLRVPPTTYPLSVSTYNYMRPVALAAVFQRFAEADRPWLASVAESLSGAADLPDRILRSTVNDQQAANESVIGVLQALAGHAPPAATVAVAEKAGPTGATTPAPTGPAWHDEALSIDERMTLVKGMGLFEQLFAAMAQTDCTACGYDCEGYARAIADGEDKDLTKCAPGELETQRMLEKLVGKR